MIFLTLPATLITFGLFLFVINAVIILMVGHFIDGFAVNSFWWALLFSIVITFINSLFTKDKKEDERPQQY
jgi:putative membrane protein